MEDVGEDDHDQQIRIGRILMKLWLLPLNILVEDWGLCRRSIFM